MCACVSERVRAWAVAGPSSVAAESGESAAIDQTDMRARLCEALRYL